MTNEELKKKIVDIIMNIEWTDIFGIRHGGTADGLNNAIADALIAAGIGDVKEAEMAANRYEMLYSMQARDMALAERKAFAYAAEIEHLNNKLNEDEHRAEVAERALHNCCFNMIYAPFGVVVRPTVDELYKAHLERAEKELAEEGKDD